MWGYIYCSFSATCCGFHVLDVWESSMGREASFTARDAEAHALLFEWLRQRSEGALSTCLVNEAAAFRSGRLHTGLRILCICGWCSHMHKIYEYNAQWDVHALETTVHGVLRRNCTPWH